MHNFSAAVVLKLSAQLLCFSAGTESVWIPLQVYAHSWFQGGSINTAFGIMIGVARAVSLPVLTFIAIMGSHINMKYMAHA